MINRSSIRQEIMKPGLKRGGRFKKKKKDVNWIQNAKIKKGKAFKIETSDKDSTYGEA
jgi:hypothetical protein